MDALRLKISYFHHTFASNFNIHRLFLSEAMNTVFAKCWFFYFYRSFFIHQTDFSCKQHLSLFFLINVFKLFICMIWTRGYLFYMHYSPLLSLFILFHKLSQVCYGLFRWFNSQISALLKINPLPRNACLEMWHRSEKMSYRWRRKMPRGYEGTRVLNPDPGCSKNERQKTHGYRRSG